MSAVTGTALERARVYVAGLGLEAFTDAGGFYRFSQPAFGLRSGVCFRHWISGPVSVCNPR